MSEAAGDTAYRVALPDFEGPLDLLLHLCKTHELDIVNIPIAFVTEKYLEYLERMQSMSVDVAAEYLVMAATLAYLKSRELVPSPEPLEAGGEDGEPELDPREELIRRLLEYQKYKDAAEKLSGRPIEGRTVFGRGMPIAPGEVAERPLGEQSVWKLIEAFGKILAKAGKGAVPTTWSSIACRSAIGSTSSSIVWRPTADRSGSTTLFDLGLPETELRHQVVVTLLAILELARLKVVRVLQARGEETAEDTLYITAVTGASLETARHMAVTAVAEAETPGSPEEKHDQEA